MQRDLDNSFRYIENATQFFFHFLERCNMPIFFKEDMVTVLYRNLEIKNQASLAVSILEHYNQ